MPLKARFQITLHKTQKILKEFWDFLVLLIFIIASTIVIIGINFHRESDWIHVEAIVTKYSARLEDTGVDFRACYDAEFYIPSENRTINYSSCTIVGTDLCAGAAVFHYLGLGDDCLQSNTPDFSVGENVIVRYDPNDNAIFDWVSFGVEPY